MVIENNMQMAPNYDQQWEDFLSSIHSYAKDEPSKWTHYTLLSYFLVKYKTANNIDFIFTFNKKGPTSSKEIKDAAKIWAMFDRGRLKKITDKDEKIAYRKQLVDILKSYIDWAFDVKFRGRQTNITGLGLFVVANFMNEFLQWNKDKKNKLPKRSDSIPPDFLEWIKQNANIVLQMHELSTLEHLNHLFNYIRAYDLNDTSPEVIVLNKSREVGIMPKQGRMELNKK